MSKRMTTEEHVWYGNEGVAMGIYERHAAVLERSGTHVPKWAWLTEEQRERWRMLARERTSEGMDSMDGFEEDRP